jgi:hypothetical protein
MNEPRVRRLIGLCFILGAVLINVPYFILIATFDYPTILREPTAVILSRFQAGGSSLILTWLAFAWVGLPRHRHRDWHRRNGGADGRAAALGVRRAGLGSDVCRS